jgi:murein DD-endopeptidase MepM/ murein hydrolase activator NlpD
MILGGRRLNRVVGKLRVIFRHLGRGFSLIVAPHGTGTTVTFNLPGRLAMLLVLAVVVFIAGLAFVGVTYTRLALFALESERLKAENSELRLRSRKIDRIEQELARVEQLRREIEAWAGVVSPDTVVVARADVALTPRVWPRRYTYAILEPYYYTMRASGALGMIQPASGWVSRRFIDMVEGGPGHPGIDIAASQGTPVRCALDGVVEAAGWDDIYGNLIEVKHNDSLSTVYGHNEKVLVKEGEYVTRGQVIATVGNTGRSTAPHLHFEVLENGKAVDPEAYVAFRSE